MQLMVRVCMCCLLTCVGLWPCAQEVARLHGEVHLACCAPRYLAAACARPHPMNMSSLPLNMRSNLPSSPLPLSPPACVGRGQDTTGGLTRGAVERKVGDEGCVQQVGSMRPPSSNRVQGLPVRGSCLEHSDCGWSPSARGDLASIPHLL